jgi:hypothetical protein
MYRYFLRPLPLGAWRQLGELPRSGLFFWQPLGLGPRVGLPICYISTRHSSHPAYFKLLAVTCKRRKPPPDFLGLGS